MIKDNSNFINSKNSIYIIHGEEDLIRIEYADKFRKEAFLKGYLNKKVFIVDSTNFKWEEISFFSEEQGLFCEKNLIEINIQNGKIGINGSKFISNLLKTKLLDTLVLFIFPKLDKSQIQSKWFKEISATSKVMEAKKVTIDKFPVWIEDRIRSYNLTIDEDALNLFINKTEGNLLSASQEIEKLHLNLNNKKNITLVDVENQVSNNPKYDIFQLSIAWMKGDIKKIVDLIEDFKLNSREPILILWVISEDIRVLLKLKKELLLGNDIFSIGNKLRLWGDKRKFALRATSKISNKILLNSLKECANIDKVLKGVNIYSQEDVWFIFKQLLISLALIL